MANCSWASSLCFTRIKTSRSEGVRAVPSSYPIPTAEPERYDLRAVTPAVWRTTRPLSRDRPFFCILASNVRGSDVSRVSGDADTLLDESMIGPRNVGRYRPRKRGSCRRNRGSCRRNRCRESSTAYISSGSKISLICIL